MKNSMRRWWTPAVSLLHGHWLLEFPWCIAQVGSSIIFISNPNLLCLENPQQTQQECKLFCLTAVHRFVWLLRGHREPYLCAEHASGQEAGLHGLYHAIPSGAPGTPGETPHQEAGRHLDQQDGEQGCGYLPAQNLCGSQPQSAGKWWQFDGFHNIKYM